MTRFGEQSGHEDLNVLSVTVARRLPTLNNPSKTRLDVGEVYGVAHYHPQEMNYIFRVVSMMRGSVHDFELTHTLCAEYTQCRALVLTKQGAPFH